MLIPDAIPGLIARGALFVVNHSGGKDSQAMFALLKQVVPKDQLLVLHAILPGVEWDGVIEHIEATIGDAPLIFAQSIKTFWQMVEHRQMFPSPSNRQCTSDLKRGPIEKQIRHYLWENPRYGGLIVNCMGMRAEESPGRKKLVPFAFDPGNSMAASAKGTRPSREWYEWLPIHALSTWEVWCAIAEAGQKPHWAYSKGMTRLSCQFCIMASDGDLKTAATLAPDMYQRYAHAERRMGFTLRMSRETLVQVTGIPIDESYVPPKEPDYVPSR